LRTFTVRRARTPFELRDADDSPELKPAGLLPTGHGQSILKANLRFFSPIVPGG
jgi:hypothetical protein